MHTRHLAVGLAKSASHARLQPICTGARQHFVDTDDMERVGANAKVEAFLASRLDKVSERKRRQQ
jgi:hypothetical protein